MAAIGFRCKFIQVYDYSQSFIVRKMLEGMKRTQNTKDVRLPITLELLTSIIAKLPSICFSSYEALLFATAFSVAFHGFLRIGEIVFTKMSQTHQIIGVKDARVIQEKNHQSIEVRLRHSKNDQSGKGTYIYISETGTSVCPVLLFRKYMSERPKVDGPLFCHYNKRHVSRYQFSSILNKSLKVIGIKSDGYKSHSFRIGAATAAALNGVSNEDIMKRGRWRSSVFKNYIRP